MTNAAAPGWSVQGSCNHARLCLCRVTWCSIGKHVACNQDGVYGWTGVKSAMHMGPSHALPALQGASAAYEYVHASVQHLHNMIPQKQCMGNMFASTRHSTSLCMCTWRYHGAHHMNDVKTTTPAGHVSVGSGFNVAGKRSLRHRP